MIDDKTVLDFLVAIDAALALLAAPGESVDLYLLGRSSLIVRYRLDLMTKDVDVIDDERSPLLAKASALFGKGSANAGRWGFYLEGVSSGLPPMPSGYQSRATALPGDWTVLRPKQLDIHDLATSKLSRFHAKDREDLQMLCDTGDLSAGTLTERFHDAFWMYEEGDSKRETALAHLARVIAYLEGASRTL